MIGGGAKSEVWNQIKADVLGVPFLGLARSEFGTWGAAMIAGKAVGIYSDLAEVAFEHAVPAGKSLEPDMENHAQYEGYIERYIELQETLANTFQSIS